MSSLVPASADIGGSAKVSRWREAVEASESSGPYFRFVAVFFGIWAVYDGLDLFWGGTAANYWLVVGAKEAVFALRLLQLALCVSEIGIVFFAITRSSPRGLIWVLSFAAFVLRACEVFVFFGLNDFFYYVTTVFLLLQFFAWGKETRLACWPREVLRYQTAWIYFATAFLKLNPHWLSGDHLWIRIAYMQRVLHWPVPAALMEPLTRLSVDHWLAIAGAAGEMSLALLLLARAPRWVLVTLAVLMHGFAAIMLNVWFFGAAMVAQVAFVSGRRTRA